MVNGYDLWMQEKKRRADADMDLESTDLNTIPELREKSRERMFKRSGKEVVPYEGGVTELNPGGPPEIDPSELAKFGRTEFGETITKSASAPSANVKGGSGLESMLMAGGINSGNPGMVAAGAGLQVLSDIQKQKQQEEVNKYNARVAKNQRQRNAIRNLIEVGQGMRL